MKTLKTLTLTSVCALGVIFTTVAQETDSTTTTNQTAEAAEGTAADATPVLEPQSEEVRQAFREAMAEQLQAEGGVLPVIEGGGEGATPVLQPEARAFQITRRAPGGNASSPRSTTPSSRPSRSATAGVMSSNLVASDIGGTNAAPEGMVRLDFKDMPIDLVLEHLSASAGYIISKKTPVTGTMTVFSAQPVTKPEALQLLKDALAENGYSLKVSGRILTVLTYSDQVNKSPIFPARRVEDIEPTSDFVTQSIPIRFVNAAALVRELQPLLPPSASLIANEAGNTLLVTDTQEHIRRVAEIIRVVDTSVASISTVRVFPLKYADAKALADVVKEVFATSTTGQQQGGRGGGLQNIFRGGGFGGGFGGGGGDQQTANANGRPGASRVAATSDERSNSLIVSAPDDLMPTIEKLVESVDTNVDDVTELRVFSLRNSSPSDMASLLTSLFPDDTSTTGRGGRGGRGGGGGAFFNPFGGGRAATTGTSDRLKKQTKVLAVADERTKSVVVSASHDMMAEIGSMIKRIDDDATGKQETYVLSLENTEDPAGVEQIVRSMLEGNTGSSAYRNTSSRTTGNNTSTRNNQSGGRNSGGRSSSGSSSGFGSGGGGGFGGGSGR